MNESLLEFEFEQKRTHASIYKQASLGTALSNRYCFRAPGLRAVEGQFTQESSERIIFRNFRDRRSYFITKEKSMYLSQGLQVRLLSPEKVASLLETCWIPKFRQLIASESLESAIERIQLSHFADRRLPGSLEKKLRHYFSEIENESPIDGLLQSPLVTDICINSASDIWFEEEGLLKKSSKLFSSTESLRLFCDRLAQKAGCKLDPSRPSLSFMLDSMTRVHIVIPPLSGQSPVLSIRKLLLNEIRNEDFDSESQKRLKLLMKSFKQGENLLVSGATGSGKTTLLRALIEALDKSCRLVTIEDTPELQIQKANVVSLRTRISDNPAQKSFTQADLLVEALRMRPDRIVVGEIRSHEAFSFVQALNTGHSGSACSIHGNGPFDSVERLLSLACIHLGQPVYDSVLRLLGRNLNLIVQLSRDADGRRQITELNRVVGVSQGKLILENIR